MCFITIIRIMTINKVLIFTFFFIILCPNVYSGKNIRVVHVFVALCDNVHQGIVKVPDLLGNGDDLKNNLYWGAAYGVKTFFKKSPDWQLISSTKKIKSYILERCIFKHRFYNVYLIADAYRGKNIKIGIIDFIKASSGLNKEIINSPNLNLSLKIGGYSNLLVYIGHNGLMDFNIPFYPKKINNNERKTIILSCLSKSYFYKIQSLNGAFPILWTTGLMAPEAYTLKSAIDGWILNETPNKIRLRAVKTYSKYQKLSIRAVKRLFVSGW